jgi:hypothetical protein
MPFNSLDHLKSGNLNKAKPDATQVELPGGRLDIDQQFLAAFKLAVWIARRPEKELADSQRAALLN